MPDAWGLILHMRRRSLVPRPVYEASADVHTRARSRPACVELIAPNIASALLTMYPQQTALDIDSTLAIFFQYIFLLGYNNMYASIFTVRAQFLYRTCTTRQHVMESIPMMKANY